MPTASRVSPASPPGERLYTLQDIARKAKVSIKTVRRLVDAGELTTHRIGTQIRVSEGDWQAYLVRSRQP